MLRSGLPDRQREKIMGNKTRKNTNNFIVQGGILAIASILVRMIGLVYRIPMTAIIGDRGNTYYSCAYSIYQILLLLSSYSLPVAVSKLVSQKTANGEYRNIQRIMKVTFAFALTVSGIFAVATYFGAPFLADTIVNTPLAYISLRFLAPAIFVVALLGVYRGFFQGMGSTLPTAISQIAEQIVNAVVSIVAAYFLFQFGTATDLTTGMDEYKYAWGAAGGTIGTGMGALTGMLFCMFLYKAYQKHFRKMVRKDKSEQVESYGQILKLLVATIVPVILSTAVYNLIDILDNSIYSHYMDGSVSYQKLWGAYSGKYLLLVHVPVAIASAMAASSVPAITKAQKAGDQKGMVRKIAVVLKCTMLIAIPAAIGLGVLGIPVIKLLYPSDTSSAGLYLTIGSLAVVLYSLSTITNGILQGVGKMNIPVRNAVISLIVHTGALVYLLWYLNMGIYGVILAYLIFGMCMATLNCFSIYRYTGYQQDLGQVYLLPGLASVIMGIVAGLVYYLILKLTDSNAVSVLIAIAAAVVVYGVLLLLMKVVTEEELKNMPKGDLLIRLFKKMKLMK